MDFKKVLEEWKKYQMNKLVMANAFPCTVTFTTGEIIRGNLTYRGSGGQRHIRCVSLNNGLTWKLLLRDVLGTSLDGAVIRFTLTEERTVLVSFLSPDICNAAHQAFLQFEREEFGLTPPSSGESESGSD